MASTSIPHTGRRPPPVPPRRRLSFVSDFEAAAESLRFINVNPEATPMEVDEVPDATDETIIKITEVDLDVAKNTTEHHTNEFDITKPESRRELVVRRGQSFGVKVKFNRNYNPKEDELKLVFQTGIKPLPTEDTHVELILSDRDLPNEWGALVKSNEDNTLTLDLMTAPTCPVGKWSFKIDVVKRKDKETTVYRYSHRSGIYILFNPWCKDDLVYMSKEELLDEYVLADTGRIFVGSHKRINSIPWSFGQFDNDILDCAMYLLDKANISSKNRGNPITVSRKMSKIVNNFNDGGVLAGNWSGDYTGGVSPLHWTGSVAILEEYFETKSPVRFGQCWVFSGVLTTVCRALGIPVRSVTNFQSAHDTDESITIDVFFNADGEEIEGLNDDSVWNFHVWNDVWMARPDLPPGYGGWQAIDATPQELSGGVYQMGPAPLLAIRQGDLHLPFDAPFVFAEVNADRIFWLKNDEGLTKYAIYKDAIGKFISTKEPFKNTRWDRQDVTDQYKFTEGSNEERAAVHRAYFHSRTRADRMPYESKAEDVVFDLYTNDTFESDDPESGVFMGETVKFGIKVKNTSNETRTIHGSMRMYSMFYTGVTYNLIRKTKIDYTILEPYEERSVDVKVGVDEYRELLMDHCFLKVVCMCKVDTTNQTFAEIELIRLRKPHLSIKAPDTANVGEEFEVEVSFVNRLPVTLTNCELRVDAPGFKKLKVIKEKEVGTKQMFSDKFKLIAKRPGEREIIVFFNCAQISAVTISHYITINESSHM